ncbi:Imm74 family immunity protein [Acidicapsa dinghuensis]|uniref:Imm74 family immunity protein n=1 Tax=Acidicapsa dinghuensis TaxID=2218256 RepID=A0ABW1ENB9_9BACT|nr:Imm74 family immunity protein [Acidicapsa dinghuensis]
MFIRSGVNKIESDTGFSVEILGLTGMTYTEGVRSMFVDSELLSGNEIQLFSHSIKNWDPPNQEDPISPAIKAQIIDNIRSALGFDNKTIVVD